MSRCFLWVTSNSFKLLIETVLTCLSELSEVSHTVMNVGTETSGGMFFTSARPTCSTSDTLSYRMQRPTTLTKPVDDQNEESLLSDAMIALTVLLLARVLDSLFSVELICISSKETEVSDMRLK